MADWAGLHIDILGSILEKVSFIEDIVVFGCVCKSWMEAAANKKKYLRPQIPWLVLPDGENPRDIIGVPKVYTPTKNHRQIYSLSKDGILTKNLYIPEMTDKRCIGLNYGWVLAVSRTGELNLVHPLSRYQIQLPHQKSMDYYSEVKRWPSFTSISRAALSANPFDEPLGFVIMILLSDKFLNYWKLGYQRWTRITNQSRETLYCDLSYSQDWFYAIEYHGKVWVCSVSNPQDLAIVMDLHSYNDYYIVQSNDDLLVVVRELEDDDVEPFKEIERGEDSDGEEKGSLLFAELGYLTCKFEVYKLDLINRARKKVRSLRDCAIFVGHNTSVSVNVSDFQGGLIKSNHIYFTDDLVEAYVFVKTGGGWDMGSYNLKNGQVTQFKVEESLSRINPPFWFIPSLSYN